MDLLRFLYGCGIGTAEEIEKSTRGHTLDWHLVHAPSELVLVGVDRCMIPGVHFM